MLSGIVDHYAVEFARDHADIPAPEDFHFEEYDDFIRFALGQNFDYRSTAKTYFDEMKQELTEDGLAEEMAPQLAALEKALELDKEAYLRLKKDELIPFIEEEIASRYYFQQGGIRIHLRYDEQLRKALTLPLIAY